jgi:hypothetical protein
VFLACKWQDKECYFDNNSTKIQKYFLIPNSWACKLPSFSSNRSPKNAGTVHFMFGGRFGVLQTGSEDGLCRFLADCLQQIKVRQQIGRDDSLENSKQKF